MRTAEKRDVRKPRKAQVVGKRAAPLQQALRIARGTLWPI
jgi:hypothetical protein